MNVEENQTELIQAEIIPNATDESKGWVLDRRL
jgi:hypothetical protein